MKKETFKVEKGNWTVTYNDIFNTEIDGVKLTPEAWGLYVFMLSLPDDWDYSIMGLTKVVNSGKNKIQRMLKELEKAGYITRKQTNKGRFGKVDYTVLLKPNIPHTDFRETVKKDEIIDDTNNIFLDPYPQKPHPENRPQQNTKEQRVIDKLKDKGEINVVFPPSVKLHYLTKELITKNFISALDFDLEKYNDLFFEMDKTFHYQTVLNVTRYLVDYFLKNSSKIKNKYYWFKMSFINNANQINNQNNFVIKPDWLDEYINELEEMEG